MDAAAAARMSDPDRNRQFSRKWTEPVALPIAAPNTTDTLGPIGLALRDAWRRRAELHASQEPEGASDG